MRHPLFALDNWIPICPGSLCFGRATCRRRSSILSALTKWSICPGGRASESWAKSKVISLTKTDVSPYDSLLFPNFPGVNTVRNSLTVFYLSTLPFAISSCRLRSSLVSLFVYEWLLLSLNMCTIHCMCVWERMRTIKCYFIIITVFLLHNKHCKFTICHLRT